MTIYVSPDEDLDNGCANSNTVSFTTSYSKEDLKSRFKDAISKLDEKSKQDIHIEDELISLGFSVVNKQDNDNSKT